jgi:nitrite reductase/ring-hydroxylating ferredoxin subunit
LAWQHAATTEELGAAHPWLAVAVAGVEIVLAAFEGTWYAVAANCTHAGCPFAEEADLEAADIICNCHGSEFDLRTGAVLRGPAERPVRSIPVRLTAEGLEVDL